MKSVFLSIALLFSSMAIAEPPIRFGVYKLKGTNPDGMKKYDGRLVIQKEGANYRLTWFIGPKLGQAQTGVGILNDKVLSVGYMDLSGGDFGVVSMKVISNKKLKGEWASIVSKGSYGEEEFTFDSENIPQDLTPKDLKPAKSEEVI